MKKYALLILFFISSQTFSLIIKSDILAVLYTNINVLIAKNSMAEYKLLIQEVYEKEWYPSMEASVISLRKKTTGSSENSIDKSIEGLDKFLIVPSRIDRANEYDDKKLNVSLSSNLYNGHKSRNRIKIQKLLFEKETFNFKKTIHNLYIEALENNIKLCNEIRKEGVMAEYQKRLTRHIDSIGKFTNNKISKMLLNEDLSKLKINLRNSIAKKNDIQSWFKLSFESSYPVNCDSSMVETVDYQNIKNELDSNTYRELIRVSSTRFKNNKDVRISHLSRQISKLKFKIKDSESLPKLNFVFSYDKIFTSADDLKEDTYAVGLQLKIPLYKPGQSSANRIAYNRIKQSEYNLKKVNLSVRNNWSKLIDSYKGNVNLLENNNSQHSRLELEISRNNIVKKEPIKNSSFKYKVELLKLEKKYLHQQMELIILKIANLTGLY